MTVYARKYCLYEEFIRVSFDISQMCEWMCAMSKAFSSWLFQIFSSDTLFLIDGFPPCSSKYLMLAESFALAAKKTAVLPACIHVHKKCRSAQMAIVGTVHTRMTYRQQIPTCAYVAGIQIITAGLSVLSFLIRVCMQFRNQLFVNSTQHSKEAPIVYFKDTTALLPLYLSTSP